jgi:hypothetical protein
MPALLPIILTVSHVLLAANTVPKFDIKRTCRPAAAVGLPGRTAAACQHDENDARTKLEHEWTRYNAAQRRSQCEHFPGLDRAPSHVELLTCLEIAKQAAELPERVESRNRRLALIVRASCRRG